MPIYEYHCDPCDHTFETLIRGAGDARAVPAMRQPGGGQAVQRPRDGETGRGRAGSLPVSGDSPAPYVRLRPAAMRRRRVRGDGVAAPGPPDP